MEVLPSQGEYKAFLRMSIDDENEKNIRLAYPGLSSKWIYKDSQNVQYSSLGFACAKAKPKSIQVLHSLGAKFSDHAVRFKGSKYTVSQWIFNCNQKVDGDDLVSDDEDGKEFILAKKTCLELVVDSYRDKECRQVEGLKEDEYEPKKNFNCKKYEYEELDSPIPVDPEEHWSPEKVELGPFFLHLQSNLILKIKPAVEP